MCGKNYRVHAGSVQTCTARYGLHGWVCTAGSARPAWHIIISAGCPAIWVLPPLEQSSINSLVWGVLPCCAVDGGRLKQVSHTHSPSLKPFPTAHDYLNCVTRQRKDMLGKTKGAVAMLTMWWFYWSRWMESRECFIFCSHQSWSMTDHRQHWCWSWLISQARPVQHRHLLQLTTPVHGGLPPGCRPLAQLPVASLQAAGP